MEKIFSNLPRQISLKDFSNDVPGIKLPERNNIQMFDEFIDCFAITNCDLKYKQGLGSFDTDDKTKESLNSLRKTHEMFVGIESNEPRILVNDNVDALV